MPANILLEEEGPQEEAGLGGETFKYAKEAVDDTEFYVPRNVLFVLDRLLIVDL